ncbi:ribonuclease HI [Breznakiella homolactica]|uniref:Ribonuclease H n=1 Tax=Breznakiella homolactica TaxID=2798577 RepID=A0A7T7XQL6_9SPIR|nr:ribonuclease HI [Breznakiella homolactica]QQO10673.1 ribonuclease HI [Breznakiella homolactica]
MEIDIYTDGACSGNPGPGGWAYVVLEKDGAGKETVLAENSGAEKETTNNRMELTAAVEALRALRDIPGLRPETLTVYTDSQYVQKGITTWVHSWKRNGWRTASKDPVKNRDLWMTLDELNSAFSPRWQWVRGHAGNKYNEQCDRMATGAAAALPS